MTNSFISGVGHYVPEKVVTNDDLSNVMDTSDEWIQERSGIRERRHATPGLETTSSMAVEASKMALKNAALTSKDIDFIVFATLSPDFDFPGSGVLLQRELGMQGIGALDIRNQCSGFIYALSVADQYIKSGMYNNILVVGSEVHSTALDMTTRGRNISVLFGDGAGAVVVSATKQNKGILSTHLHADGDFAEELYLENPGSRQSPRITHEMIDNAEIYPYMNGREVFKHASTRFPEAITEALQANGKTPEDLDLLVPHQANMRIIEYIRKTMHLPEEKVFVNIQKYGNTTAASIPVALSEALQEGRLKDGSLVCLAAFGSGYTWASALIKW